MVRQISEKKQYGVFYTPKRVADLLCTWAIRSKDENILEPSFGGCDFLDSSLNRFVQLGVEKNAAKSQLFGCDIDDHAFDVLALTIENPNGHFKRGDFLSFKQTAFPVNDGAFDVVIGNPPYVSHHNMADEQKNSAIKALSAQNMELGGRASLWAYFVLHSLSFLKFGGRMAWVLPSSFLYADYAKQVRTILAKKFEKCLVINLHERLFLTAGTEEISVITLCENLVNAENDGKIEFVSVSDVREMENIIRQWEAAKISSTINDSSEKKLVLAESSALFERLSLHPDTKTLGDLFNVQIGIVSGANSFFILNEKQWRENSLPEIVKTHILTKFRFAKGLSLKQTDIETIQGIEEACLLVDTTKAEVIDGALADYLASFPEEKKANTTTFKRRKRSGLWHRFNDNRIPVAFFPYMQNIGTWIVLNGAQITATNSIHRLYSLHGIEPSQVRQAAISILSTFSQISAEIEGRTYGAGVLKHEPSEAVKIRLLLPLIDQETIDKTFEEIDGYLRQGFHQRARKTADRLLLTYYAEDIQASYACLDQELITLQQKRSPLKKRTQ
jgi:adenine-specific DNA-methyltransferase